MALGVGRLPAAARRPGFWYLALLGCRRVECGHPRRDPKAVALRAADPFRLALADRHHYCELLPALLAGEFIGWHDPTLSVGNTVLQTTTSTGNATHRSPVGSLRLPYAPTSGGGEMGRLRRMERLADATDWTTHRLDVARVLDQGDLPRWRPSDAGATDVAVLGQGQKRMPLSMWTYTPVRKHLAHLRDTHNRPQLGSDEVLTMHTRHDETANRQALGRIPERIGGQRGRALQEVLLHRGSRPAGATEGPSALGDQRPAAEVPSCGRRDPRECVPPPAPERRRGRRGPCR